MTTTTGAPSRDRAPLRRGSNFSDRQIAHAVKDGRAISVDLPSGEQISGWVYGVDDYHWGVVTRFGDTYLVHKSAPCIKILDAKISHLSEDQRQVVEAKVDPFRSYLLREHFNATN